MKKMYVVILLVILFATQISIVQASSPKHKLKILVEKSTLILSGKVKSINAKIENDGKRDVVFTYVTLKTKSIEKGELNKQEIIIKMLGGRVGSKGGWSEQWFSFNEGEEVMVFLNPVDFEKNIWEIESASGKLPIVNIKGVKKVDCTMLREDEVSKSSSEQYFEEKQIKDRIKNYLSKTKGGK